MTKNIFSELNESFLIAEIGVNHNGDVSLAKELIREAKKCGADAVKFQTYKASSLASPITPKVEYQLSTTSAEESHLEMLQRLELSHDAHLELAAYCVEIGIEFMSTPYDLASAKFLGSMSVRFIKTASADLVDLPLQRYIASMGKPTIVATGMATLGEIERVVNIYEEEGNPHIILLHCVSNYPCSDESINLRAMNTLANAFGLPVGFSDHSKGHLAAVLSVGLNAKVIEKHFTLDKKMDGPDHAASSTPAEFSELVRNVRRAESILGEERKRCQPEERQMAIVSRKSLILSRSLASGEIVTLDDLELRRPGTGIEAGFLSNLVGTRVRESLPEGHQLKWSDLDDGE